jgi:hypothetical protein
MRYSPLVKRYVLFGGCRPRSDLVVSDFTALGRGVIADRDPSGGADEEAEKRGLVHRDISSKTVILAVQRHVQIRLFNLKLPVRSR